MTIEDLFELLKCLYYLIYFKNYFQPYENVFVSMAETESKVITKLVQAMYLGQTTVTKKEESELKTVIKLLGMKMPLNSKEDTETDEESEQEVVKDSTTAMAKSKDKTNVFSDEDEITQGKKSAKSGKKVSLVFTQFHRVLRLDTTQRISSIIETILYY